MKTSWRGTIVDDYTCVQCTWCRSTVPLKVVACKCSILSQFLKKLSSRSPKTSVEEKRKFMMTGVEMQNHSLAKGCWRCPVQVRWLDPLPSSIHGPVSLLDTPSVSQTHPWHLEELEVSRIEFLGCGCSSVCTELAWHPLLLVVSQQRPLRHGFNCASRTSLLAIWWLHRMFGIWAFLRMSF